MDMSHTTEVTAIFVRFLLILAIFIWLPWQRPLDPCNQKCLLSIGSPQKPPAISHHILIISPGNAYMTTFVPKSVAMVKITKAQQ